MKTEYPCLLKKKVADLTPADYNPRTITDEAIGRLTKSLAELGNLQPITWNVRTGRIVGGHQRLKCYQAMGKKEVEVWAVDLSEDKEKAANLALNKLAGEFDPLRLKDLVEQLDTGGIDLEITGFSLSELGDMMSMTTPEITEDVIPEPPAVPIAKPGDLWLLGDHRLLCGDCARTENLEALLAGATIDATLTDPPYCSGGMVRGDRTQKTSTKYVQSDSVQTSRVEFTGDSRDQRSFLQWAGLWIGDAHAKSRDGSLCMVFTDWRQLPLMTDAIQGGGFVWRNLVTWWKPGCRMQRGRFSLSAEYLLYSSRGVPDDGEQSPQNVLQCRGVDGEEKDHIAQKPVELLAQVMGVTKRAAIVYDPFLGSGTTLIAAEQLGRKCYGMEISPAYCDVIVKRWENLTGRKAELCKS